MSIDPTEELKIDHYDSTLFVNFTEEQLREIECIICYNTVWKPYALNCGHLLCSTCIDSNIGHYKSQCPMCKEKIGTVNKNVYNQHIIKKIYSMSYKCPNNDKGCPVVVDTIGMENRNINKHINECAYDFIQCTLCRESICRAQYNEHKKQSCTKRTVKCNICGKSMLATEYTKHSNNAYKCTQYELPYTISRQPHKLITDVIHDKYNGIGLENCLTMMKTGQYVDIIRNNINKTVYNNTVLQYKSDDFEMCGRLAFAAEPNIPIDTVVINNITIGKNLIDIINDTVDSTNEPILTILTTESWEIHFRSNEQLCSWLYGIVSILQNVKFWFPGGDDMVVPSAHCPYQCRVPHQFKDTPVPASHSIICPERPTQCNICQSAMAVAYLSSHQDNEYKCGNMLPCERSCLNTAHNTDSAQPTITGVLIGEEDTHELVCSNSVNNRTQCDKCKQTLQPGTYRTHLADECSLRERTCTHCRKSFKQTQYQKHTANTSGCAYLVVLNESAVVNTNVNDTSDIAMSVQSAYTGATYRLKNLQPTERFEKYKWSHHIYKIEQHNFTFRIGYKLNRHVMTVCIQSCEPSTIDIHFTVKVQISSNNNIMDIEIEKSNFKQVHRYSGTCTLPDGAYVNDKCKLDIIVEATV